MKAFLVATVCLLAALQCALAMPGSVGACKTKNYTTVDLDASKYQGQWYEIAHSDSFVFGKNCYCTAAKYGLREDKKISVLNTCRQKSVTGSLSSTNAVAFVPDASKPGSLIVKFNFFAKGPYDVVMIGENYEYSVVASCPTGLFSNSIVWILSRTPTMDAETFESIKAKVTDMGFILDDLVLTPQKDCPPLATEVAAPAAALAEKEHLVEELVDVIKALMA